MTEERKSIFDRFLDSLPEEEKIELNQRMKLISDNEFYKTETMLDIENKEGEVVREVKQEVKIYRDVKRNMTVSTQLLISFGGYREYNLDQKFINTMLKRFTQDNEVKFCIDSGARTYVKNNEIIRILKEGYEELTSNNVKIEEDFNKDFRESEMGQMIQELGMII